VEPREHLDQTMRGYQDALILLAAAQLGLFDALARGECTAPELARDLECDERALEILLLALAADGFLQVDGGKFALAPAYAPFLAAAGEQSLASMLRHHHHLALRWVELVEVVRSGKPAARAGGGRSPDELADFIGAMADISRTSSLEVARKIDLTGARRLLDLGGGPGTAALTFARGNPALTCVIFDLPEVVLLAEREIARRGLGARVTTRAGDFLRDELGGGYDVVYLSNIIHGLGPDEVAVLLGKVRHALQPGGSVLIKDFFLDESRTQPVAAARFSVNMLVNTESGRSYTRREAKHLLAGAGFSDFREFDVAKNSAVMVGRRE